MPSVMHMHWPGITMKQYEEARERVNWEGDRADGADFHVAAVDDEGAHIVDIWESPEHFQRFAEQRLMPVLADMGIDSRPDVTWYDVHAVYNPGVPTAEGVPA